MRRTMTWLAIVVLGSLPVQAANEPWISKTLGATTIATVVQDDHTLWVTCRNDTFGVTYTFPSATLADDLSDLVEDDVIGLQFSWKGGDGAGHGAEVQTSFHLVDDGKVVYVKVDGPRAVEWAKAAQEATKPVTLALVRALPDGTRQTYHETAFPVRGSSEAIRWELDACHL